MTEKKDILLIAAAVIGVLVLGLSLYTFFGSPLYHEPFDEKKTLAFKDLFDTVVKGTLLPLFTTLITAKVAYMTAMYLVRAVHERSHKRD